MNMIRPALLICPFLAVQLPEAKASMPSLNSHELSMQNSDLFGSDSFTKDEFTLEKKKKKKPKKKTRSGGS